jgi:hypothetical protein
VVLYSYGQSNLTLANADPADDVSNADVWTALATPGPLNGGEPPFPAPAEIPTMAWKAAPETGAILLRVPGLDGARVEAAGARDLGGETDGTGVFGVASVPPGRYTLTVRHPALAEARSGRLDVTAGAVAVLELP